MENLRSELPAVTMFLKFLLLPVVIVVLHLLQLQLSLEEVQFRAAEMEQEMSSLQRERDGAQKAALFLQSSLDQLTQVRTGVAQDHKCIFYFTSCMKPTHEKKAQ